VRWKVEELERGEYLFGFIFNVTVVELPSASTLHPNFKELVKQALGGERQVRRDDSA